MGSDAAIYEFDYRRYVGKVVPAFHHLLLTGKLVPWLQEYWDQQGGHHGDYCEPSELRPTYLLRHCTYLRTKDLAFPGHVVKEFGRSAPWEVRSCKSTTCPERTVCPFHENSPGALWEGLMCLFEEAVEINCLPRGQFVGRTMYLERYGPTLEALGVPEEHSLRHLLSALGSRGYVIQVDIGDLEGFHGWLTPTETVQLRKELDRLDLPYYPAGYDEMEQIFKKLDGDRTLSTEEFRRITLSFVRTVSYLAEQNGMGLLWGNDVLTSDQRREMYS